MNEARRRSLPQVAGVSTAARLRTLLSSGWNLDNLAGRLIEVSGYADTAALTLATRVLHEAQRRGEAVAWIATEKSTFYPPDLAANGIDLAALPVVWVKRGLEAARASDTLLRSGGFALLVLDLGAQAGLSLSVQTRISSLAKQHHAAVLALTRKERRASSLGSLVSLRAFCARKRTAFARFSCEMEVLKDKRGGPGWRHMELCRGPDGLC